MARVEWRVRRVLVMVAWEHMSQPLGSGSKVGDPRLDMVRSVVHHQHINASDICKLLNGFVEVFLVVRKRPRKSRGRVIF